jgi:tRNA A-37 threonylcarbamoyl transferase component Bud32/tetratricopeptide (TPR) repeat protein
VTGGASAGDGARARRAQELFDAARQLDEAARAAYLLAECAEDSALRVEVEALLRAAAKVRTDELPPPSPGPSPLAPGSLTAAILEMKADPEPAAQLQRGDTVGRFVVLGLVGRGGMGEVYAAYDPELDRKVAVKLVRPRQSRARDDRGRLLREAQAIAKLSHQNVVVIYDVGTIDQRVFIAMEFVEGSTVGSWLKKAPRSRREILDVFLKAGAGLAAAHQAGLVHRDFKPDNVMIGDDGQVRVMDFGLARQVLGDKEENQPTDETTGVESVEDASRPLSTSGAYLRAAVTQTGVRLGSPAYMSPEQFLGGAGVDARTDQFSFSVALYEALYGERPFAGETVLAIQVNVLEGELRPAPPQSRVPKWIRRVLLRGLSIDPVARFPSMAALLSALADDPALRTRKWALAGVAVAAVLGSVGVTHRLSSNEASMCSGARAHFAGIWDVGLGTSERKAAIRSAFVASGKSYAELAFAGVSRLLDQYVARWTAMYTSACEATHVRGEQSPEVLDLRMACLQERLGNVRALSDVFAAADGNVVENAVSAAAALPALDRCADVPLLRAVVKPPEDPATRKRVGDLRRDLAQLNALRDSGQCARAAQKADRLISDVRAVGYPPLLADTLYASAQVGVNCGDVAQMIERFREAHEVASASHNDDIAAQASALIPPFAMNRLGQDVVAREWLRVARGDVARLGRETLADAMLAQAQGMFALSERDYGRAMLAADRSIAVTRRLLGPDDPLTIQWEANKGDWLETAGRLDEALQIDVQALEHFGRVLGHDHPRVAHMYINEGEVLNLLKRYEEARGAYQRAAELLRQSGADVEILAWALTGLGRAQLGLNRPVAAVAPLDEALRIRLERRAPSVQLGETRFALARALWVRPDPDTKRRARALAAGARRDYAGDQKIVAEIDAWLAGAR